MNKKKIFISTAIPYVNARPHIGHALELVEADVLARFYREQGNEVFFFFRRLPSAGGRRVGCSLPLGIFLFFISRPF